MPIRFFLILVTAAATVFFILRSRRPRDYRAAKFYKTLYRPEGFELGIWGRRRFGRAFSHFVARLIGLGYAATHPRVLHDIRANIALLDPSKATLANAIGVCMQQALNFREYTELGARQPAEVLDMLGEKSGIEHIERARELGKGCLFVTGHLGFFELGGLVMSQMGYPITALTLPEPTSALTEWRAGFRKRWGVETVVVGGDAFSAVEITRRLREGAMVALLCDRPFDSNTVTFDLPHGRIPFSTSPVLLSLLSGAPIVAVSITRQADGKFAIHAEPPMFPQWLAEGREATLAHFTTQMAQEHLVPMFQKNPDQWLHFSRLEK
jgi:KDO2-lipid IV(A) lauroyltransferase